MAADTIKFPALTLFDGPTAEIINREHWLGEVARLVEPLFKGFRIEPYRVTCGWPCVAPLSPTRRRVGECHGPKSSKDGTAEVFISPCLDDPLEVAGTLMHELAHVVAGVEADHGRGFVRVCGHVGLTRGRPREVMPGKQLEDRLRKLIAPLGSYPHAALLPVRKSAMRPPSSVRLVCDRCECPGMTIWPPQAQVGLPTSSSHLQLMVTEE